MVNISELDVSKINDGKGLPHGLCDICGNACQAEEGITVNCPDFKLSTQYQIATSQQPNQKPTDIKELEETFAFRESCPECVKEGKVCGTLKGEDVCLTPFTVAKEVYYEFKPCEKNPNQNISFLNKKIEV
jgi:hypothetical protein